MPIQVAEQQQRHQSYALALGIDVGEGYGASQTLLSN